MVLMDANLLSQDAFAGNLPKNVGDLTILSDDNTSLAVRVLKAFGIDLENPNSNEGGVLPGYDVKLQDAYTMIRLSLVYKIINGVLMECYINEEGKAEFITVGANIAELTNRTYLSVRTLTYALSTDKVMLTGYKAAPSRRLTGYYDFETIHIVTTNSEHQDKGTATLYADNDTGYLTFNGNTRETNKGWRRIGRIDWTNTRMLDSLYGVDKTKFETVSGYAYHAQLPRNCSPETTTMSYSESSTRFTVIDALKGITGKNFISAWNIDATALDGNVSAFDGIRIPDTGEFRPGDWLGVEQVYVYGYSLETLSVERDETSNNPIAITVDASTQKMELISLSRGTDYIVVEDTAGNPIIVFANYVADKYNEIYSSDELPIIFKGGTNGTSLDEEGKLRDGEFEVITSRPWDERRALSELSIFPKGDGSSGYAISQIVIASNHNLGAISVEDSATKVSRYTMDEAEIYASAIIVADVPAPVVLADESSCGLLDHTPREASDIPNKSSDELLVDLTENDVQLASESMTTGDIQLTLPFFDEDDLCTVATNILNIAREGRTDHGTYSTYEEIMLTCDPSTKVSLGDEVIGISSRNRLYVNEINYSYQDSSQYVINITAGAKWVGSIFGSGFGQADNNLKVSNVTKEGVVVGAGNNNFDCLVSIDGFGTLPCVNTASPETIITQGDTVKVTIYNVSQGEI